MEALFGPGPVVAIQGLFGPGWETFFRVVSLLGSTWGIILGVGLARWLLGRRAVYGLLAVVAVETVLKKVLAAAFFVSRPEASAVVVREPGITISSFPSGHVSTASALGAYLGFGGAIPLAVGLSVGVVVSVSRLFLGVHWLGDVLAGLFMGTALAWAGVRGRSRIEAGLRRVPEWGWGLGGVVLCAGVAVVAALWLGDVPRQWEAAGFLAGLGVALPAQRRWLAPGPVGEGTGRRAAAVAVGVLGLACLWLVAAVVVPDDSVALRGALVLVATLWALLGTPLAFGTAPAPRPSGRSVEEVAEEEGDAAKGPGG